MTTFEIILAIIFWWHIGFVAYAYGCEWEIEDKTTRSLGYALAFLGPICWFGAFEIRSKMKDFDNYLKSKGEK